MVVVCFPPTTSFLSFLLSYPEYCCRSSQRTRGAKGGASALTLLGSKVKIDKRLLERTAACPFLSRDAVYFRRMGLGKGIEVVWGYGEGRG